MYYKENKQSKFDKFLAGKGFYAVLAICVLTVAVATYLTVATFDNKSKPKNQNSQTSQIIENTSKVPITSQPAQNVTESELYSSGVQSQTDKEQVKVPNTVAGYFVLPVTGEILKDYSDNVLQFSNTYNDMRLHLGLDIAANEGTAVKSAGDGKILSVEDSKDFGTVITIDHGNKVTAKYCGLKNITVKSGDIVAAGQAIGEIGTVPSECVDEAHLHFETYKDGKSISPTKLIEEFLN